MPRTHIIHDVGRLAHLTQSTTPHSAPVVRRGEVPKGVPLRLPAKFLGRSPSKGGAMSKLCDDLRVYGCNVNPVKAGTTGGERQVISRRPKHFIIQVR